MQMSKKLWYVHPRNQHTNEVIARKLPPENAYPDVLCIDGRKRDLWLCAYSFIAELERNRRSAQIDFTAHYRENRHGPVREWLFARKAKLTLASAIKKGSVRKLGSRLYPVK